MVLTRAVAVIALVLVLAFGVVSQAGAHKNEQHEGVGTETTPPPSDMTPGATHERMEEHAEAMADAQPKTLSQRVMSWVGRTHPFAVHFPIALFPVALVALVLARRRGEAVELIRALIIVAGAASVVAAVLGWLSAGFVLVDSDAVQLWHRWIGTALAILGGHLAFRAWRRRDAVNSPHMVAALGLITLVLLVQSWLGAALVHGMGHMSF